MRSVEDYLALVPPAHASKPNFMETLRRTLAPLVAVQQALAGLPEAFDLDEAVGVQLDVVGLWIGRSRRVAVPIEDVYFSFDILHVGFDEGVWRGPFDSSIGIVALGDPIYRKLLYANIAAKHWDGTVPGAQAAYDVFFDDPETLLFVQDDSAAIGSRTNALEVGAVNLGLTIAIAGKLPLRIYIALLDEGGIPIKPGGVKTTYAITSVDGAPLFGFDVQNAHVSGFDTGAFGVSPAQSLALTAA